MRDRSPEPREPHGAAGAAVSVGPLPARGLAVLAALVAAHLAVSWRGAETTALAAAGEQGRALLASVSAAVRSSLDASRAVETLAAARMTDALPLLDRALAASVGDEAIVLGDWCAARGWTGAWWLDDDLDVIAAGRPPQAVAPSDAEAPFAADRVAPLAAEDAMRRLRAAPRGAVLGYGGGPFGGRREMIVSAPAPSLGGVLAVRADAAVLERFEADAGITRLLGDCAHAPGVAGLVVQRDDGVIVAAADGARVGSRLPPPSVEPAWTSDAEGRRTLDVALPASWDGPPRGWIRVALDAAPVDGVIRAARRDAAATALAVLAVGAAAAIALARSERRRLAEAARLREELAARERFASLGRIAGGVAHEIRGPLNALSMASQLLAREAAPDDGPRRARFDELAASIRDSVRRVDATVRDFLALGRGEPRFAAADTDLAEIVADAVASEGGTVATSAPDVAVRVCADRALLAKAIANLIRNARAAAPPETVRVAWRAAGSHAEIDVEDRGAGVPVIERERIFEPFRSGRPGGVGLGLAIARDAVERHRGTIRAEEAPGGGARFRVCIPREPGT